MQVHIQTTVRLHLHIQTIRKKAVTYTTEISNVHSQLLSLFLMTTLSPCLYTCHNLRQVVSRFHNVPVQDSRSLMAPTECTSTIVCMYVCVDSDCMFV